jgi:hypothetical protein
VCEIVLPAGASSRLGDCRYFAEHNVEGMLATLRPLHEMMDNGPETLREVTFQQVRTLPLTPSACLRLDIGARALRPNAAVNGITCGQAHVRARPLITIDPRVPICSIARRCLRPQTVRVGLAGVRPRPR